MGTPLSLVISCFGELQNNYENKTIFSLVFWYQGINKSLNFRAFLLPINQSQKLVYISYCFVYNWVFVKPFTTESLKPGSLWGVTIWGFWPLVWVDVSTDCINYKKSIAVEIKSCFCLEKHSSVFKTLQIDTVNQGTCLWTFKLLVIQLLHFFYHEYLQ